MATTATKPPPRGDAPTREVTETRNRDQEVRKPAPEIAKRPPGRLPKR